MNRSKLSIPPHQHIFILAAMLLLLTAGFLAYSFHQTYILPKQQGRYSLEREVSAVFAGRQDTSADAPSLNRLVRGKLKRIDERQQQIIIATYVNFPDTALTRDIPLSLTPRTQFLCWAKTYRSNDGTEIDIEQAGYLLDENSKLFQRGEQRIDLAGANDLLSQGTISILVALEMPYSLNRENRVFQVALLGCNDN